jgi:hypothetical protein
MCEARDGVHVCSLTLSLTAGPLPRIEGISNVDLQIKDHVHQPQLPSFTQVDKDKFWSLFLACGPVNGLLNGKSLPLALNNLTLM